MHTTDNATLRARAESAIAEAEKQLALYSAKKSQAIRARNERLHLAVAAVRIERNPATVCELYDALNQRRAWLAYAMPEDERRERAAHYDRQLRLWGRVEERFVPHAEGAQRLAEIRASLEGGAK